jgi:hypothetical protein
LLGIKAAVGAKYFHLSAFLVYIYVESLLPKEIPLKTETSKESTKRLLQETATKKTPTAVWNDLMVHIHFIKWAHLANFLVLNIKTALKGNGWYETAAVCRIFAQVFYVVPVTALVQFLNTHEKGKVLFEYFEPTHLVYWAFCDCIFLLFWIFTGMVFLLWAYLLKVKPFI